MDDNLEMEQSSQAESGEQSRQRQSPMQSVETDENALDTQEQASTRINNEQPVNNSSVHIDSSRPNHSDEVQPPSTPPTRHEPDDLDMDEDTLPLGDFDWDHLQARFNDEMLHKTQQEQQINLDFASLTEFYMLWARTPMTHEYERAAKRLRTRVAYVQHEEQQLEQKRAKHDEVVQAFQSALALLSRF